MTLKHLVFQSNLNKKMTDWPHTITPKRISKLRWWEINWIVQPHSSLVPQTKNVFSALSISVQLQDWPCDIGIESHLPGTTSWLQQKSMNYGFTNVLFFANYTGILALTASLMADWCYSFSYFCTGRASRAVSLLQESLHMGIIPYPVVHLAYYWSYYNVSDSCKETNILLLNVGDYRTFTMRTLIHKEF